MKTNFINLRLVLVILSFSFLFSASAQEKKEPVEPSLSISYLKLSDGTIQLTSDFGCKTAKGWLILRDFKLNCYVIGDSSQLVGSSFSNRKGLVKFIIPPAFKIPKDKDGNMKFKAEFNGNDTLLAAIAEVAVQDLTIDMQPENGDSTKTVNIWVYSTNVDGKKVPLTETPVMLYVSRMFSYLKIGEAKLDSTGMASINFPVNLPGDSVGNLTIIAKIEENELFWNVEKTTVQQWGIATRHQLPHSYRSLWSEVAPVWMIITLTVMLFGVWGHYAFAIFMMVKIKKSAKKKIEKT
jgi:hypothetical protein